MQCVRRKRYPRTTAAGETGAATAPSWIQPISLRAIIAKIPDAKEGRPHHSSPSSVKEANPIT